MGKQNLLRRILPTVIDTKYEIISSRERWLAKTVAKRMVELPQLSVWAFLIPIIFLFHFLGYRRRMEIITLNLLFTKKLALEAARDIMVKGQSREEVIAMIEAKTLSILEKDKQGIYSEKIRLRQMDEINILLDHYLKLLNADGKSYRDLVRRAYRREDYEAFLHQLSWAEKAVNQAALQAVGKTKEAISQITRMEKAIKEIRQKEVEEIFS